MRCVNIALHLHGFLSPLDTTALAEVCVVLRFTSLAENQIKPPERAFADWDSFHLCASDCETFHVSAQFWYPRIERVPPAVIEWARLAHFDSSSVRLRRDENICTASACWCVKSLIYTTIMYCAESFFSWRAEAWSTGQWKMHFDARVIDADGKLFLHLICRWKLR